MIVLVIRPKVEARLMFLPRRDSPCPPMHSRPRMCSFDDALLPGDGGSAELWRESAILHTGVRLLSRAET